MVSAIDITQGSPTMNLSVCISQVKARGRTAPNWASVYIPNSGSYQTLQQVWGERNRGEEQGEDLIGDWVDLIVYNCAWVLLLSRLSLIRDVL